MSGEENCDLEMSSSASGNNNESSQNNQSVLNDQEREWLVQAEDNYNKKQFDSCLKCLKNLQSSIKQKNPSNTQQPPQTTKDILNYEIKVLVNVALCDLATSRYKNTDEFKQELKNISSLIKIDIDQIDTLEDSHHSILFFNYAVYLYFNKQYSKCFKIINKLYYQFNEMLDDKLFKEINFLFVDLLIQLRQPAKALTILQNFEKTVYRRGSNSIHGLNNSPKSKSNTESDENVQNNESSESNPNNNVSTLELKYYQQLITLLKLKCHFLMNSPKQYERELKHLSELQTDQQFDTLLKAKESYLLSDNSNSVKQLLSSWINHLKKLKSDGSPSNSIQHLEQFANSETNLVKHSNSSDLLFLNLLTNNQSLLSWLEKSNSLTTTTSSLTSIYLNNLALVHYSMHKFNLSCLYLQKSLNENLKFMQKLIENTSDDDYNNNTSTDTINFKVDYLSKILMNRQNEILFNMGISYLLSKQPLNAFECLYKLVDVYKSNARLWLRLAECCIMCYRHGVPETSQNVPFYSTASGNEKIFKLNEKIKCISKSFGSSFHHKIHVGCSISSNDSKSKSDKFNLTINDYYNSINNDEARNHFISLEFAYMCLKNALNLLPSNKEIFSTSTTGEAWSKLSSVSASKITQQNLTEPDDDQASTASENLESAESNDKNDATDSTGPDGLSPNINKINKDKLENKLFNCVWPSKPINIAELQNLRSSILISLSFVTLCLRDYLSTIKYCKLLLDTNDQLNSAYPIARGLKYLAHSYLAEALLYSDKIADSIEQLSTNARIETDSDLSFSPSSLSAGQSEQIVNGKPANPETGKKETGDSHASLHRHSSGQVEWYPRDINTARAISYFNLSVAHAVRGEVDMAYKNFNMSVNLFEKKQPAYSYIFFMKIYLDLLDGNRQSLQTVLKEHFPHCTLNKSINQGINSNSSTNASSNQKANMQSTAQSQNQQQQLQQQLQQSGHLQPSQLQLGASQTNSAAATTPTLSFQQLQQQQQHLQQLQLQQMQMQQLQHQLQQQQLQQQLPPHILQSQNLNQFLNNPNLNATNNTQNNLLMNSFANASTGASTTANLVGLPPALSPFNHTNLAQPNNLTSLLNPNSGNQVSGNSANSTPSGGLSSAFGNLPNLNSANILLAAAAAAAAANNSNSTVGNTTPNSQISNPISLYTAAAAVAAAAASQQPGTNTAQSLLNQNQLSVNPLLLQQQQQQQQTQQQQQQQTSVYQLPSRIS